MQEEVQVELVTQSKEGSSPDTKNSGRTSFGGLPDEVLSRIFIACLPQSLYPVISAIEAPLLLGRVCSRWRVLAFQMPVLWNRFQIFIPLDTASTFIPHKKLKTLERLAHKTNIMSNFRSKIQRYRAFIQQWLSRAGPLPLSISIRSLSNPEPVPQDQLDPYHTLLVSVAHRIRTLEMTLGDGDLVEPIGLLGQEYFPLLEELNLIYAPASTYHEYRLGACEKWEIFQATNLHSLSLHRFPTMSVLRLQVDWESLTHFNLEQSRLDIHEAYLLLLRCSELVSCTMEVEDSDNVAPEDFSTYPFIYLPHLEYINITEHSYSVSHLLQSFETPSLRTVEFYSSLKPSNHHQSSLISLLSRCPGGISRLTIDTHSFTYADLINCLSSVPFLTHFAHKRKADSRISRLQEYASRSLPVSVVDSVLRLLTPTCPEDVSFYCPLIMHLSIQNGIKVSDRAVLSFIHSRRGRKAPASVAKLCSVNASLTHVKEEDPYPELEQYIDDGMRVSLSYLRSPPRLQSNSSISTTPSRRSIVVGSE